MSPNILTLAYIAVIFVAFYFLLIRPQQKRAKEQQQLMAALKVGDRIVTAGGLYGTIERVEDDMIELRIADGVVVDMARSAVVRRIEAVEPDGSAHEHPHLESGEVEEPPVRVKPGDEDGSSDDGGPGGKDE